MITGGVWYREGKIIRAGWGKFPQKYESAKEPKNELVKKWMHSDDKAGLLLLGPPGTGKTYEAVAAIRAIVANGHDGSIVYTEAADFHATMRATRASREAFDIYAKSNVLVIDDFYATSDRSDWMADMDYQLINYRYNFELPTMIVANLKPNEVAGAFGDRITSRLREMAMMVVLTGPDRRSSGRG